MNRRWLIHVMWLALLALGAEMRAEITQAPDAMTVVDRRIAHARFLKTNFSDTYLAHGRRDPAWDEPMQTLLSAFEHHMAERTDARDLDDLKRQAVVLVDAGCNDALLGVVFAYAHGYFMAHGSSIAQLRHTIQRLPKQQYSPYVEYLAASYLAMNLREDGQKREAQQYEDQSQNAALRFIHGGAWHEDGLDALLYMVDDQLRLTEDSPPQWRRADKFLAETLKTPNLEAWLPAYWRGQLALNKAWSARGTGWTSDLRDDQVQRYRQYLAEARAKLIEAHRLAPHRPEPATEMIRICWGHLDAPNPEQDPRYWFEQAVEAQFDYEGAYRWMSFTLLPRWGGDHHRGIAFARECLATGRFDTQVPYRAIDVLREIAERDFDDDYAALERFDAFDIVQPVLHGYLETEHDPLRRRRYASELLVWCWLLKQKDVTREVWEQLDGDFDVIALDPFDGLDDFNTGLVKTMIADDQTVSWLSQISQRFETGDWIDLTFEPDLTGWTPHTGQWQWIDEHTVEGRSTREGLMMFLDLDAGCSFELEGVIEFVHAAKPRYFAAGLFFAQRDENPDLMRAMLLRRDEPGLMIIGHSNVAAKVADAAVTDRTAFRIRIVGGRAKCWVADELIYTGNWLTDEAEYEQQQELALGGFSRFRDGDVFRFSDLRLRCVSPK